MFNGERNNKGQFVKRPDSEIIPIDVRFWSKVRKGKQDECWPWTASFGSNKYGQIRQGKKNHTSHRLAYELTYGSVPKGMCVLHQCDNTACCNPLHLRIGTHAENMRDMIAKGRNPRILPHTIDTSERERAIKTLYIAGFTTNNIARLLHIKMPTVNVVIDKLAPVGS